MPALEQSIEVLRQFCHGDLDAFESLFRRHQSEVYGWIVRIVRDPAAAEDLTVETFWRIYRMRARFDPARNFEPWARRIATNAACDYLKTMRPEMDLPEDLQSAPSPDPGNLRGASPQNRVCISPASAEAAGRGHAGADRRATLQGNC